MPELPEVEVCRLGLLPRLAGQVVRRVDVRESRLRQPVAADLGAQLADAAIASISRRGKYLLIRCQSPTANGTLIAHLGMSGNLRCLPPGTPAERHDHVDFHFDPFLLRYSDPRRFGLLLWWPGDRPETCPLLANLGLEPLSDAFDGDWLHAATRSRQAPIKPLLMDPHLIVGIGNIYASESLFLAGISPLRAAGRIALARCHQLAQAIRSTLQEAIAQGGSSIRDYLHADGSSGCFQLSTCAYERAGAPCLRCGGTIRQIRQAGRSTYYCPQCQR